jgi:Uma2 family endonuclease
MQTLTKTLPNYQDYLNQWKSATWEEYLIIADTPDEKKIKLYYYQNEILTEMGKEGINHASVNQLITLVFGFWFSQNPEQIYSLLGGCLLEKPKIASAAPDLVLYLGENYPKWTPGERRYLNLDKWGVPNLVGEISDTTLPKDLDEKKHLYASLKIPEYWVIDVFANRVFCFQLQENNQYQQCDISLALTGLPISLLEQALTRLETESNGSVANWFLEQIANLKQEN